MSRNRTKAATIAFVLMLTIAATFMACLPTVNAADIPTYAFLTVSPNPVGVGQTVKVVWWLDKVPPTAKGNFGDRWEGVTVTITKPGGTTQTMGPYKSDPIGGNFFSYAPDTVGNYSFQVNFPGQRITGIGAIIPVPIDNYYQPSTSTKVSLTVQQEPIEPYPSAELPTDYWERPISAENREWYSIGGNWLGTGIGTFSSGLYNACLGGCFNPYTKAPNSAHIVWTKPLTSGGLVGGEFGSGETSYYYAGAAYEPEFYPPVVINGVLYYNTPNPPRYGFYAVDLRTGEQLWWRNSTGDKQPNRYGNGGLAYTGVTCGQIYYYNSPNQQGCIPYLWGVNTAVDGSTTYSMYDAITGNWILNLVNGTAGTIVMSPVGDMLVYILGINWLAMWNSSKAIPTAPLYLAPNGYWMWRPDDNVRVLNWRNGIQWNVTVGFHPGQAIAAVSPDIILATTGNLFLPQNWQMEIGYSAKDGHQMWIQNRTTPTGSTSWQLMGAMGNGVYVEFHESTMQWYGFDAYTGQQLWGPTEPYTNDWGFYNQASGIAYGKLYAQSLDGLHCFDLKTGTHSWDFSAGSSGFETVYGIWPTGLGGFTIADGKIYVSTGAPWTFRGARLYCIDADTGKELWSVAGWLQGTQKSPVISDGYLVTQNGYNGKLYCFGKGKTATTVSVQNDVITNGSSVLIKGTVLDQSPGARDTPAISDKDMTAWMEYLYMQKPCPTTATGVPVLLQAMRSDGTVTDIATVTSDVMGHFEYLWTPPTKDTYKIMATFLGSESYWMSSAETAVGVTPAPAPAPVEGIPAYPDYTPMFAGIIAAVVVAIVLVIYDIFRKRK